MSGYRVETCEASTAKLPLLSNEEKEELFQKILDGDMGAREQCIKEDLRLILSVIQRFSNSQEDIDDLFQIGCAGLIKAIDNLDITQNVRFSICTMLMTLGEVRRYLRDNNSIRVSRSLRDTTYETLYAREWLTRTNSEEPTLMEIAQEIGVPEKNITYALDAIQTPVSLYGPVYTDGRDPLFVMDQTSDKKNLGENWVGDLSLIKAMKRLPKWERHIINIRLFEGKIQTEVAQEIHISQTQVSHLEKNTLKSTKFYLSWPLKPFSRCIKLFMLVLVWNIYQQKVNVSMERNGRRLAILINADNVSPKYIKYILDEVSDIGVATRKRIYGDRADNKKRSWRNVLLDWPVNPIQQYSYTAGKNATGSVMIIDAANILHSGNVDGFCLVPSDSDFTKLAQRLREAGMFVVGIGE